MMKFIIALLLFIAPQIGFADAVIFSGNDVKSLKYNLDLFGRSKILGLNVDPRAGAGVAAPLASFGMDYLTGKSYTKVGPLDTDWAPVTDAIYYPGCPNCFAGYNSTGVLSYIPGWQFDPTYFGLSSNHNIDPPNTVSYTQYNQLNSSLVPTQASPDNANAMFQIFTSVDPTNTGFGLGVNGLAVKNFDNSMTFYGTGANGSVQMQNIALDLGGGGGAAGSVRFPSVLDASIVVRNNYTVAGGLNMSNFSLSSEVGSSIPDATNGISLSYNILGNYNSASGGTNGFTIGGTINPTNTPTGGYTGFINYLQMNANFPNTNIFADNINVGPATPVTIADYSSFNAGPQIITGSTITNYKGMTINAAVQNGATVGNYTGLTIGQNINAGATVNTFTGLNINATNYVHASGFTGTAIDSSGFHNFYNPIQFPNGYSGFLTNANYMGGQFLIASGSPVTALDGFGDNLAWSLDFQDNVGPGAFGLGVASVGFVGQVGGALGKTFSPDFTFALGGGSVPPTSTGGTMPGETAMFKSIGVINAGGTISITNLTSFLMPAGFGGCAYATNCWGVRIDEPAADNSFAKNVVVGASQPTNASTGLELNSTTKAMLWPRMTTAQRTALTAVNGMQVYDTDANAFYCYKAGAWGDCASASPGTCPVRSVAANDTATSADCQIHATGSFTETLYTPSNGDTICVKNAGTGTVIVDGGGNTIDGETQQTLYGQVSLCMYGFGGNWFIK